MGLGLNNQEGKASDLDGEDIIPARPLYFGKEFSLFGWYHSAQGPSEKKQALVIVNPNSFDMQNMHWGLRRCAEKLAGAGVSVLRFDLHGTGDSLGDDEQPGRVAAWLQSVDDAIDLVKSLSGCAYVTVMGVRLGATLAAKSAEQRDDVTDLILYVPCVTGRQYIREQRTLAAALRRTDDDDAAAMQSNDIELAGWLLSSETLHELETLDMSKLSYDKMNVFYIHRQELAVDRKLLQSLELSAKTVEVRTSVEFSGFSQDALFGVEPVQDFQAITQWVASKPCEATEFVSHTELASTFENTLRGEGFLEQPLFFGRGVSMFGVLCIPEKHEYQFCVVFVSTGANHRIGSQRLTVDLARRLASQGISSFRIDISGVGDSQTRAGCKPNQVYFLPAYEDVVQAVDAMTERGYTDVIVSGMCSGAYLGYNAAVNDPRIKILFILNLFRFIWRDSDVFTNGDNIASAASLESYGQKLFRWSTWRRFLKGRVNIKYLLRAITNRLIQKIKSRFLTLLYRVFSPGRGANAVERDCVMMLRRGTHINLVFSADDAGMDEVAFYLGDRGHVLRRYPGFSFRDVPGADHTFTTKQSRSALVEIYMDCIRKYQRK